MDSSGESSVVPAQAFATTHWSVVERARDSSAEVSRAMEQLCSAYWYPLYAYIRRRGHGVQDAQDLTQAFFARLLEHNYLRLADRNRGRFRTFLLSSLTHFLTNERHGKVWFLASPFGTVKREVTIPTGKALFIALLNAEASDLEYGTLTEEDQRALAEWLADHIATVSCTVDGKPVKKIDRYRVQSPQFSFNAPDPWVFSPAPSGEGTAVADGYFVMLTPLSKGKHTVRITGSFHFDAGELGPDPVDFGLDVTYCINVVGGEPDCDKD